MELERRLKETISNARLNYFASLYREAAKKRAESITLLAKSTHPHPTDKKRPEWGIEIFDVESPPIYSRMPE